MSRNSVLSLLLVVFWSSGFVGATLATREAPFETALVWRTVIAAVLLSILAAVRRERLTLHALRRQTVLGILVHVVYLGGCFAATRAGVPAGTVALIAALQPLVVAALAGPMLGTSVTLRQSVGLALGAGGVALVVAGDVGSAGTAGAFLLPVVAVLGLAAGTLLDGRWHARPPLVISLAVQSSVAAVVFSIVATVEGRFLPETSGRFWFAVAWLVMLSTFGGYGTYLLVVRRSGPALASTLLYLTPPVTALWAWAMFGQRPALLAIPGILVCALGVSLFARGRPTPSRPAQGEGPHHRAAGGTVGRGDDTAAATSSTGVGDQTLDAQRTGVR